MTRARLPPVSASRRPPPRPRKQCVTRPVARPALLVTRRRRCLALAVLVQPRSQGPLVEQRAIARSTSASHPRTSPDSTHAGEQRWRSCCRRPAQTALIDDRAVSASQSRCSRPPVERRPAPLNRCRLRVRQVAGSWRGALPLEELALHHRGGPDNVERLVSLCALGGADRR